MEETYTFSRALHLMRYGGKKMKPLGDDWFYFVENDSLMVCRNSKIKEIVKGEKSLESVDIMGLWVEVRD